MSYRALYLLFVFLISLSGTLSADVAQARTDLWAGQDINVQIGLTPERTHVKAGETITLAIQQVIRPGWHTYWRNPGDSGEQMRARWQLPEGASVSEMKWPPPHAIPFDPLMNFGYEDGAVIFQDLTLPATDIAEGPLRIPVAFDILVCKDICIPETFETALLLNTGPEQDNTKQIAELMTRVPESQPDWPATLSADEQNNKRTVEIQTSLNATELHNAEVSFFPYAYGLFNHPAPQETKIDISSGSGFVSITQEKGEFPFDIVKDLGGVLVVESAVLGRVGYEIPAPELTGNSAGAVSSEMPGVPGLTDFSSADAVTLTIGWAILYAVIGGMILNLMPCVFPVLFIKVLGLVKMGEKNPAEARLHGLSYTAGIISCFLIIAGLLFFLQSGGAEIGWGFQFQNPMVVLLLAFLFATIGLNFSGLFEFSAGRLGQLGQNLTQKEGMSGSFFTGVLATIVATPCTAPFMAGALGYALTQPPLIGLSVFVALGFGLALPYLILSFSPALAKSLPKPGPWMVTFKEFLAFPMFATVAWLLWVLSYQVAETILLSAMIGLTLMAMGLWMLKKSAGRSLITAIIGWILLCGGLALPVYYVHAQNMVKETEMPAFGEAFSTETLEQALRETDRPVFVEMTAAWCITCEVNNFRAIDIPQTREMIADRDILYLVGDWTNYDGEITRYLERYGRRGVPLYVYYGAPDTATGLRPDPVLLPEILSPSDVAEAFEKS